MNDQLEIRRLIPLQTRPVNQALPSTCGGDAEQRIERSRSEGQLGGIGLQIAARRHRCGSLQHAVRNVDSHDPLRRMRDPYASAGRQAGSGGDVQNALRRPVWLQLRRDPRPMFPATVCRPSPLLEAFFDKGAKLVADLGRVIDHRAAPTLACLFTICHRIPQSQCHPTSLSAPAGRSPVWMTDCAIVRSFTWVFCDSRFSRANAWSAVS